MFTNAYAAKLPSVTDDLTNGQSGSNSLKVLAGGTWATIRIVAQVLAVAAVVFAGLRYMFTSAEQRADIKKSTTILAVGAVLVFCATIVLEFIIKTAEELLM